jgi:Zn-dependent peptidase ImmA (M78 family)
MINEYIEDICELLNISVPTVSYDTSHFASDTMMAQCNPSGNTIYLKKCNKPNPDYLFSIAHELRHIWQAQTDEVFYFASYKPIDLCDSVELYNLQIAEIDANAFADIIMIDFFHLQPLFEGLSDSVKDKIHERMDNIIATL